VRNRCPHCGNTAFPTWRKLLLGPAATAKCRACGQLIGVDKRKAWLVMLPAILVIVAAPASPDLALGLAAIALDVVALFVVYALWVPLEKR